MSTEGVKKISQEGIDFIKSFEGVRLRSYADAGGTFTIGWGSTRYVTGKPVGYNETITLEAANVLLYTKLNDNDVRIAELVKVPLSQNEWDAVADFEYNLGDGALAGSTFLRILNTGDFLGAAPHLLAWDEVTVNGTKHVSPDLLKRRQAEMQLFLS